jgi:hypothetical protein
MLIPKRGDNVTITYRTWAKGGVAKTKYRSGQVAETIPIFGIKDGYNVRVNTWYGSYWHAIDHKHNKLAFSKCPEYVF